MHKQLVFSQNKDATDQGQTQGFYLYHSKKCSAKKREARKIAVSPPNWGKERHIRENEGTINNREVKDGKGR